MQQKLKHMPKPKGKGSWGEPRRTLWRLATTTIVRNILGYFFVSFRVTLEPAETPPLLEPPFLGSCYFIYFGDFGPCGSHGPSQVKWPISCTKPPSSIRGPGRGLSEGSGGSLRGFCGALRGSAGFSEVSWGYWPYACDLRDLLDDDNPWRRHFRAGLPRWPPDYSSNLRPPKTFAIWLFRGRFGPFM